MRDFKIDRPSRPTFRFRHGFLFAIAVMASFGMPCAFGTKRIPFNEALCEEAGFRCVTIGKGDTWETLFPDSTERDAMKRLNRVNVRLRPGMRIAVPEESGEGGESPTATPFAMQRDDIAEKTLFFDPARLAWGAYDENGALLRWGAASGGSDWCADIGRSCRTPEGEFRVFLRGGAGCRSGKYPVPNGGARMPYCIFFARGYAFHGSTEVPGYNASHGCVRLFTEDARWINEIFAETPSAGLPGTRVVILPY